MRAALSGVPRTTKQCGWRTENPLRRGVEAAIHGNWVRYAIPFNASLDCLSGLQ